MRKLWRQFGMELLLLFQLVVFFLFFGNGAAESGSLYQWWMSGADFSLPAGFIYFSLVAWWCLRDTPKSVLARFISKARPGWMTAGLFSLFLLLAVSGYVFGFPELSNLALFGMAGSVLRLRPGRLILFLLLGSCFSPQWVFGVFAPWLQHLFSGMLETGLSIFGIDAVREGTRFRFANGAGVQVGEECSGIRGAELFWYLALLFGVTVPVKFRGLWLFIAAVPVLSFFVNLLRILIVAVCVVAGQDALAPAHDWIAPVISLGVFLVVYLPFVRRVFLRYQLSRTDRTDEHHDLLRDQKAVLYAVSALLFAAALTCLGMDSPRCRPAPDWMERGTGIKTAGEWRQISGSFCDDTDGRCLMSSPARAAHTHCVCGEAQAKADRKVFCGESAPYQKVRLYYRASGRPDLSAALLEGWSAEKSACNPEWFLRNEAGMEIFSKEEVVVPAGHGRTNRVRVIRYGLPKPDGYRYYGTAAYAFSDGEQLFASRLQYCKKTWLRRLLRREISADYMLFINMRHAQREAALDHLQAFLCAYTAQLSAAIPDHSLPERIPDPHPDVRR